ncbi:MAG: hypothetical protein IMZ50_04210 [Candidatus Atribacteria bacterium]|nr:hypothetical protein [Candidatus Atribacteria bacterium]
MTTVYLERITVKFPNTNIEFTNQLTSLIDVLGQSENHVLELASSDQSFFPKIRVDFQSEHSGILTDFALSNGETTSVKIENSTGLSKQSPHSYKPLSVGTVNHRLLTSGVKLVGIDHVGFNLPWFSSDLHPGILQLREHLSSRCLYHKFPTGEPWDFIIPGNAHEIAHRKDVDYARIRKPKFEVVSFDKASTPLIQFDIAVNVNYETFAQLFPESLNDPELRNIWVYLENPYTMDVCLVINEFTDGDWSDYFKECRL